MKVAIIGAGPGGYVAALRAARLGADVSVIEGDEVGGTCLNLGCIPTKALLASAEMLSKTRELAKFGLDLNGTVSPNLQKIMERKNKIVATQVKGIRSLLKSWSIPLISGRGRLISAAKIEVTQKDGSSESIEADRIIIATGSRPANIKAFPFDGKTILSSDDALSIQAIPKSMLIVGAGVIGCEFACIFSELGTEITMVEMMPRAVCTEDVEISSLLARELRKKKIKLLTSVAVQKVDVTDAGVTATLADGQVLSAEKMLVSIGRSFNSTGMGLEEAGVKITDQGAIVVNDRMQTNVENIYAVGDVTGGILLAHTASKEGIIAAQNICGHESAMDYTAVPAAIFTSPEIASVGLREFQAEERGITITTGHFQFRALGKAHALGEIAGLFKLVAHKETDRILGAHIIGPHASDLIHEATLAIQKGMRVREIAETIHAHPTLSEGLMEAAEDVHGMAIHIPKK